MAGEAALRIEDLSVSYYERERTTRAVDRVSLEIGSGRVLAVVGESGCGKTTLALAALNLVPAPGRIDTGRVLVGGRNVLALSGAEMRRLRGSEIALIPQDPVAGLNPVMTIGGQVAEVFEAHRREPKNESKRLAIEALARQGLAEPERVAASYPFQLSGGMCQRVMIAIATMLRPRLIIADEPTSSLDVTVQASVLRELDDLRRTLDSSILLIAHDLAVVAHIADEVAVMYAGRIVERGATLDVYARPQHPYTAALLEARPRLDDPGRRLRPIRGAPPDLAALSGECAYLSRCTKAVSECRTGPWPALRETEPSHQAACFNPVLHG